MGDCGRSGRGKLIAAYFEPTVFACEVAIKNRGSFPPPLRNRFKISSDFAGRTAKKPLQFPPLQQAKQCRRGGMVDTADLKSVALKGVPVRVRPAVFLKSGWDL